MKLENLSQITIDALRMPLTSAQTLKALDDFSTALQSGSLNVKLSAILSAADIPKSEIEEGLAGVAEFLKLKNLKAKLKRELGDEDPFSMKRVDFKNTSFEGWAPLGLLVHVTPANAWTVGFLSVVEGLLAGNVNVLKLSSSDSDFAIEALKELGSLEPTGALAARIHCVRISSSDKERMKLLMKEADGVSAWGGEEAIRSLREMTPEGARFIEWGPKISFGYFTKESVSETLLDQFVKEVCEGDQQACSAPQSVYLENASESELKDFARKLATSFEKQSSNITAQSPDMAEQSEITVTTRMLELKKAMGLGDVISGDGWRVMLDFKNALRPSPLYRSLWVKTIKREEIVATLRPLRRYLQTVGLASGLNESVELSQILYQAGVLRITPVGFMMSSYEGEPHDGVFALTRYTKRVSMQADVRFKTIGRLEELVSPHEVASRTKIMQKEDFQAMEVPDELAPLTFRSGGSSGEPKFSRFTYSDYHAQMRLAGFGLVASGLDPSTDRCMNLFFGGGLYGGFVSFFSVLESLGATQFPMAAMPEHQAVGESIVTHRANTLLGMPSYLIQLFAANEELFKKHKIVKKIFYGGEHFQESQKSYLKETFGVELIHSAAYGSVDAGPLGYQCLFQKGGEHHLHHDAHGFEVVELESDKPAQVGRLLVSTHMREGQRITRYDLGDLVRVLPGACPCGRAGVRVELLGRHGDVIRVGSSFFNYARMSKLLSDHANYAGEMQLKLLSGATPLEPEKMVLILDHKLAPPNEVIEKVLTEFEPDFKEAVFQDKVLIFEIEKIPSDQLSRVPGSGKLIHVIDRRGK
ncbi:MAG: hypothetical protein K2P81_16725 [Bacteriovoracaceae bacterium]|nr:hypothetical protein [Bacteriovoracaceae bacterium]